jgi:hypothetical protein
MKGVSGGKMVRNHTPDEWPRPRAALGASGPRTSRLYGALGVVSAAQTTPRLRGHSGRIRAA